MATQATKEVFREISVGFIDWSTAATCKDDEGSLHDVEYSVQPHLEIHSTIYVLSKEYVSSLSSLTCSDSGAPAIKYP